MKTRIRKNKYTGEVELLIFKKCELCLRKGWYSLETKDCRKCRTGELKVI